MNRQNPNEKMGWKMKLNRSVYAAVRVLSATVLLFFIQPAAAMPAASPAQIRVAKMQVDLWPEYDDPRVLVIYSGDLEPNVQVPTQFTIVIPRGAQIHMAGAVAPNGGHIHSQFETKPKGDNLTEVSYQLQTRKFYMEFYYDPFTDGENREFRYPLVSPYPISTLRVIVQQPLKARNFHMTPTALDVVQDQKGFNYYRLVFDKVPANEEKAVTVSYRKKDRKPSVAKAGSTAAAGGGKAMRNILIIGGLLLVGVVGYGVFANSKSRKPAPVRAGARRAANKPAAAARPRQPAKPGEYKYCTECGAQMRRSDNFCPNCGTKAPVLD